MRALACLLVLGAFALSSSQNYNRQGFRYNPLRGESDVDELEGGRRFDLTIPCWLNPFCAMKEIAEKLKNVASIGFQLITQFVGEMLQPSLVFHFDGFCEGLGQVFIQPYSQRVFKFDPNIDALLKLVFPSQLATQELGSFRLFLNTQLAQEVIVKYNIELNSYTSAGAWLKAVVDQCLALQQVQSTEYYQTLLYFQSTIQNTGPPPSQIREVTIYFPDVFKAFDLSAVNSNKDALAAMKLLLTYMQNFKLDVDLKGFQFQQCYTRADFLIAFLKYLQSSARVSQTLKATIPQLIRVVVTTGSGKAPVDYVPVQIAARGFPSYGGENPGQRRNFDYRKRQLTSPYSQF